MCTDEAATASPTTLTDAWIARLNATSTEAEWNTACEELKAEFGGYPSDWFPRVIMGGIADRAQRRFAQSRPIPTTKLKNGAEEATPLVAVTMMALRELIKLPIPFYELVMICRDRNHKLWSNTASILQERNLLDETGRVHDSIRNIVLSAVSGEGIDMVLGWPVEGEETASAPAGG